MTTTHAEMLSVYTAPGPFTRVDGFAAALAGMPGDVGAIVNAVQGILIHEALAPAYSVTLSPQRAGEKQMHAAAAFLSRASRLDARPLTDPRPPAMRVVGVCRHFATLFVALARMKGVPARARCGFANYFEPGKWLDHWVGEYWNGAEGRWALVDAQVDDVQRRMFAVSIDTLDVPRDRFLVAGDAWRACREGADPMNFGVAGTSMWGLVEVYGDLFQDLAALQNIELLPWGWYGLATDEGGMAETALIDRLAVISSRADAGALDALREELGRDARLRVPSDALEKFAAADRAILG